MGTVQEIKAAAAKLTPEERADLLRWLAETEQRTSAQLESWHKQWNALADKAHAVVGPITWKRGDLYAR
jgi:hypothetical protein